jgi:hypothetical protein
VESGQLGYESSAIVGCKRSSVSSLANRAAISCRHAARIHLIGGYFDGRFHDLDGDPRLISS